MTYKERKRIYKAIAARDLHGMTTVDLATTGLDIPCLGAGIMLRPTKAEGLYVQMGGRLLRTDEGKRDCFILDHAGLALMHGLIQEEREWSLYGPPKEERRKRAYEREKSGPKMAQCEKCSLMHRPAPRCPGCGNLYGQDDIPKHAAGELVEITPQDALMLRQQKSREVTEAETLEELEAIGRNRGYTEGWAKSVWARKNSKLNLF
jgi:superfamily II DNA or RNA helicase